MEFKKDLVLITASYPFGTGESFVHTELSLLAPRFRKVYVLPISSGKQIYSLPSNAEVVPCLLNEQTFQVKPSRKFLYIFKFLLQEFVSSHNKSGFLNQFRNVFSYLMQNLKRAQNLERFINEKLDGDSVVYYSYWMNEGATALSILSSKKLIRGFYSRVHGYDLFRERWPDGIIPMNEFHLKHVRKIFAVSKTGFLYLNNHYPQYSKKFHLSHLGVIDRGTNPLSETNLFRLVSCSNIIDLKRVHLIPEILSYFPKPLEWVHFGDGPLRGRIEELTAGLTGDVRVILKGNVTNNEIIDYYKSNTVSMFIHLSNSEGGVPLALQEAASFGIPLIGSDAGGVSEIVNERTGLLLPLYYNPQQIGTSVSNFLNCNPSMEGLRNSVKQYWREEFNVERNVDFIFQELIS